MLIILHTTTSLTDAAAVASVAPCRRGFDEMLRPGFVIALTGSRTR